jgi:hypothetical protein
MTAGAGFAVLATVAALGAAPRAQTDSATPTTIEQALMERACSTPPVVALDPDKHEECLQAKLGELRADFGRDLTRLSAAERRKIDSACTPIRGIGREAYLDCLAGQLVLVQRRLGRGREAAASSTAAVAELPAVPVTSAPVAAPRSSSLRWALVVALTTLLAGAIAVPLVIRLRRSRRVCRVCGTRVGSSGDMCPACRHEAAEVLRRAAAERTERQRSQEDQERRQRERAEEDRRRLAQDAEEAQRQQELASARAEGAQRLENEGQHVAARAGEPSQAESFAEPAEAAFDPYAVLGVPHDASFDAIQAAYEQAKSKYDLEQVADLGFEITQHYIAKGEAAGRAFEMLAEQQRHTGADASADAHANQTDAVPAR